MDSSRVGEMMIAPVPFRGMNFNLKMSSTTGTRKANVFPLPVFAEPTKSRPSRSGGIDLAWISVMLVKPMSAIPLRVALDTCFFRDEKLLSLRTTDLSPSASAASFSPDAVGTSSSVSSTSTPFEDDAAAFDFFAGRGSGRNGDVRIDSKGFKLVIQCSHQEFLKHFIILNQFHAVLSTQTGFEECTGKI